MMMGCSNHNKNSTTCTGSRCILFVFCIILILIPFSNCNNNNNNNNEKDHHYQQQLHERRRRERQQQRNKRKNNSNIIQYDNTTIIPKGEIIIQSVQSKQQYHHHHNKQQQYDQQVQHNNNYYNNNISLSIQRKTQQDSTVMKCNGLTNLCTKRINEILFVAGHNGNTALVNGYKILPNHYKSLETSLRAGYRGIQVDISKCYDSRNNTRLQLIHASCLLGQRNPVTVFRNINNFLIKNPNEVIMIVIEINYQRNIDFTLGDISKDVIAKVPGFQNRMYSHPDRLNPFIKNKTSWPTLQELIAVDQRIILFTYYSHINCYNDPNNCPIGFHDWFAYAEETQYAMKNIQQLRNISYSCTITRGYNGRKDIFSINNFLQIPRYSITAHYVNPRSILLKHLQSCTMYNNRTVVNYLLVDFWDTGNVVQTVQYYNSLL